MGDWEIGRLRLMAIERLQAEIEALSDEDFAQLRDWFLERDWERWDRQLEADVAEGKLDFLIEEARLAQARMAKRSELLSYDPAKNLLYLRLDERTQPVINRRLDEDIVLDLGSDEQIVGIEILDASNRVDLGRILGLIA
ncbi:MAG: DUF2283 domain-containing protein [Caldilineaceae bacterium]|nr:DUF2283 domain-containing protein [Caldilineaceae bacterium]MBP8122186.1 DUF2283 domain-containing protein [Caldilineaceae bacterium]